MPQSYDFERAWLEKLSRCVDQLAGAEIREQVLAGSESLSFQSPRQEVIAWTQVAMERLSLLVGEEQCQDIMAGCACQYPRANLQEMRQAYERTGDVGLAHRMLQERFESFLRETLSLEDDLVTEIVGRGWGVAGIIEGDTVVATKIPKSGNLYAYMQETDPQIKRQLYCHCPRIAEILQTSESLSPTYCYCGAGYYKGIWEEILQQPVQVEVLESVLQGDEVCKVAITLPGSP